MSEHTVLNPQSIKLTPQFFFQKRYRRHSQSNDGVAASAVAELLSPRPTICPQNFPISISPSPPTPHRHPTATLDGLSPKWRTALKLAEAVATAAAAAEADVTATADPGGSSAISLSRRGRCCSGGGLPEIAAAMMVSAEAAAAAAAAAHCPLQKLRVPLLASLRVMPSAAQTANVAASPHPWKPASLLPIHLLLLTLRIFLALMLMLPMQLALLMRTRHWLDPDDHHPTCPSTVMPTVLQRLAVAKPPGGSLNSGWRSVHRHAGCGCDGAGSSYGGGGTIAVMAASDEQLVRRCRHHRPDEPPSTLCTTSYGTSCLQLILQGVQVGKVGLKPDGGSCEGDADIVEPC
ncbi:hypothetical protein VOLCADRAFT_98214 [Volvox carteri f. nagariensis]|uniref:Uncharacterized protein n=1 Tax=Volvox carteri f. nagariensis TaxID=3068 RepID=D8UER6_VOLCA|nr:uncharacterized protein VOLCADRAFT_98214 [Volvox carteri f. nagariensis]EFJ41818.1 hypothetical protein VOLCADRAFT_98214 [Volvox carteri f. nagariensis]|eukprot:XP_002957164.1 hypothetical protein VOLCADRAFT_98214 [Volvox carteri f. nagariensis]